MGRICVVMEIEGAQHEGRGRTFLPEWRAGAWDLEESPSRRCQCVERRQSDDGRGRDNCSGAGPQCPSGWVELARVVNEGAQQCPSGWVGVGNSS